MLKSKPRTEVLYSFVDNAEENIKHLFVFETSDNERELNLPKKNRCRAA